MEIREINGKTHIEGYVCITDKKSRVLKENGKRFVEEVEPRCFARALRSADNVDFLLNHDKNLHLGSIKEGNISLTEDNIGLKITADVDNEEVRKANENGGFSGFSYGFICHKDEFRSWKNGIELRTLKDIDLLEVSLLDSKTTPAYLGTTVTVRQLKDDKVEVRCFTEALQDEDNIKDLEELRKLKNFSEIISECLDII